jgi:hypothetical protein
MVSKLARGAFLIFMGLMLVAYLLTAVNAKAPEPAGEQIVITFYC